MTDMQFRILKYAQDSESNLLYLIEQQCLTSSKIEDRDIRMELLENYQTFYEV